MARTQTLFRCGECGWSGSKWVGRCPDCGEWNTVAEAGQPAGVLRALTPVTIGEGRKARPISEVSAESVAYWPSGIGEFDRVLGGGLVPGAAILLSGEPGVGKSTLLLETASQAARAGNRVYDIGRAVEAETHRRGFRVLRELCGHGVGRTIHEAPTVPNYYDARCKTRLTEGLVITIEPILAESTGIGELQDDRWTIRTADGSLSAHFEHTIVITKGAPLLLTAA